MQHFAFRGGLQQLEREMRKPAAPGRCDVELTRLRFGQRDARIGKRAYFFLAGHQRGIRVNLRTFTTPQAHDGV